MKVPFSSFPFPALPAACFALVIAAVVACPVGETPAQDSVDDPTAESEVADAAEMVEVDGIDESGIAMGPDGLPKTADAAVAEATDATPAVPVPEAVNVLFGELSSGDRAIREAATQQLAKMGPPVIPPLQQLKAASSDPEAVARAALVIQRIQQSDLPKRIRNLIRQPENLDAHRLYGWPRFAEVVGTSRAARQLFIELLEPYPQLCERPLDDETEFAAVRDAVFRSIAQKRLARAELSVADGIAAQYLMIRGGNETGDRESVTVQLVSTYPYSTRLNDRQLSKMLRQLTDRWLLTLKGDLLRPMLISLDFDLPNGRELALQTLQGQAEDREYFTQSMLLLARFGEPEDLAAIEPFLEDRREVFQTNVLVADRIVAAGQQYRDLALMASLEIREMNVRDYFPQALPHPTRVYLPQSIVFSLDGEGGSDAREAAFEKYRQTVEGA